MTEQQELTSGTILIVDDDPEVRHVLRAILESAGYSVMEADNGRQALLECSKHAIRLMITDLVMPEKEGIETIKVARRSYPELRIIAISGAFGGEYLRIAELLGADVALPKPLRMDALLEAVHRIFQGNASDSRKDAAASK